MVQDEGTAELKTGGTDHAVTLRSNSRAASGTDCQRAVSAGKQDTHGKRAGAVSGGQPTDGAAGTGPVGKGGPAYQGEGQRYLCGPAQAGT